MNLSELRMRLNQLQAQLAEAEEQAKAEAIEALVASIEKAIEGLQADEGLEVSTTLEFNLQGGKWHVSVGRPTTKTAGSSREIEVLSISPRFASVAAKLGWRAGTRISSLAEAWALARRASGYTADPGEFYRSGAPRAWLASRIQWRTL